MAELLVGQKVWFKYPDGSTRSGIPQDGTALGVVCAIGKRISVEVKVVERGSAKVGEIKHLSARRIYNDLLGEPVDF